VYCVGTPPRTRPVHPVRVYILRVFLSKYTYKEQMDEDRQRDEAFLKAWTIPEEDRSKYTSQPGGGEYRWFRSPNIVCLERYRRRLRASQAQPS
jgi:hypothetical protein